MAAMIAARRAALSKFVEKLGASPFPRPIAAAATRSFNTGALREYEDDGDLDRRHDSSPAAPRGRAVDSSSFQDVFDPFNPSRSLSQVLNMMDQMFDNPFFGPAVTGGPRFAPARIRRGWDAREDNEALHLRIDMPGLAKEHVKVWAEKNTLVIKGEGEKEPGEDGEEAGRRYSSRIDLPPESYRVDQIKAEMKNGVLKVVVPKVKEEERNDVFQVNVE